MIPIERCQCYFKIIVSVGRIVNWTSIRTILSVWVVVDVRLLIILVEPVQIQQAVEKLKHLFPVPFCIGHFTVVQVEVL